MTSSGRNLLRYLLVLTLVITAAGVTFGVNYLLVTRSCPDDNRYELPSFASSRELRCRKNIKIQDYSRTFSISPSDIDNLKQWSPFAARTDWDEQEWSRNTVPLGIKTQKTELEKKARELSSFWYKLYHTEAISFDMLVDTSDSSEYIGYIDATFIVY